MGFLKVLGGIAAGVGMVAAAPVFGAVGAVSLVGAGVGAVVGGVAGSVISSNDEEEQNKFRNERNEVQEKNAEYSEKMKGLEKYVSNLMNSNIEKDNKIKIFKSLLEVGLLMGWADGELCQEEKEELIPFLNSFPEYGHYLTQPIEKQKVLESILKIKNDINLDSTLSFIYTLGNSDGDFSVEEQRLYKEISNFIELNRN